MRRIFIIASVIAVMIGTYYLYQRQLGAIPFLLLSIYFFIQAYNQLSKKNKENVGDEKGNGNDKYS
ncbi:hypothetical protein [Bacillus sp. Bva_UNVM-123]|uniref:hypothetical protein n=1 Tax=Bacillus sp. Bva_UNVM-123 TaxID=2829798 RepID=UPI00391F3F7D